jgi:hypothetical protein
MRNAGPAVQSSVPRCPGAAASPDLRHEAARTEPGPTRNT